MNDQRPPQTDQEQNLALYALRVEMASLKEFLDERNRRFDDRFHANERAVDRLEVNNEKWRHANNEWRAAMLDREEKFALKDTVDTAFAMSMKDREGIHDELKSCVTKDTLRQAEISHDTCITGLHRDIETVSNSINIIRNDLTALTAKGAGMDNLWAKIIAAIGAAGAVGYTLHAVAK
jgi:hypothetical protein